MRTVWDMKNWRKRFQMNWCARFSCFIFMMRISGDIISMKMAKERGIVQKKARGEKEEDLRSEDERLFAELRNLRMELAREAKVPPYIIFSDKSLRMMCRIRPRSRGEMLSISGVGEYKYEKYGEKFLNIIGKH